MTDEEARAIAQAWTGTELEQFVRTGSISAELVPECTRLTMVYVPHMTVARRKEFRAFGRFIEYARQNGPRGAVEGWTK